jgi:hypothetical protein
MAWRVVLLGDVLAEGRPSPCPTIRRREEVTMAKKPTISIENIDPQAVPDDEESIMLVLPLALAKAKDTYRTAGETIIKGDGTQKDRGIELDYPKPKLATRARTQTKG